MHSIGGKTGEQQTGNEWALRLGSAASTLHFPPDSPVLAVPGGTGQAPGREFLVLSISPTLFKRKYYPECWRGRFLMAFS